MSFSSPQSQDVLQEDGVKEATLLLEGAEALGRTAKRSPAMFIHGTVMRAHRIRVEY